MVRIEMPELELEQEITFESVPKEGYADFLADLDTSLYDQLRQNGIREAESVAFAAKFTTTL